MKLYYLPGACSLASHIVLEWIGAPYDTHRLSREELKSEAYRRISPLGAVPALEVDGWVLTQNAAILGFLADSFPAARLGGDGTPKGRAQVNHWLAFVNSDVHPAFKPLFGATAYLADEAAIGKTRAHAKQVLRGLFERVNAQLQGRDWIAGTRSIADPYLFVTLRWAHAAQIGLADLKDLGRFFERMHGDAAVVKAIGEEETS